MSLENAFPSNSQSGPPKAKINRRAKGSRMAARRPKSVCCRKGTSDDIPAKEQVLLGGREARDRTDELLELRTRRTGRCRDLEHGAEDLLQQIPIGSLSDLHRLRVGVPRQAEASVPLVSAEADTRCPSSDQRRRNRVARQARM